MKPSNYQSSFTDLAHLEAYEQEAAQREATLQQTDCEQVEYAPKKRSPKKREQQAVTTLAENSSSLKAAELLGAITGLDPDKASEVLAKAGGLHELARLPPHSLMLLPHMTPRRATMIRKMTEWALMLSVPAPDERLQVRSPADIANLFKLEMSLLDHEQLRVVGLNTKNKVVFVETIYKGSLNTAVIRVAEVLKEAIIRNCASIALAHNHPSGDPTPSPEDVRVTELIRECGAKLDIDVIDHVIIGNNRFVSLKERGLGFG